MSICGRRTVLRWPFYSAGRFFLSSIAEVWRRSPSRFRQNICRRSSPRSLRPERRALGPARSSLSSLSRSWPQSINTGVNKAAFFMNVLTAIKFFALLGVAAVIFVFGRENFSNLLTASSSTVELPSGSLLGGFGLGLVAVLWAYSGWQTTSFCAGEVRRLEKTFLGGSSSGASWLSAFISSRIWPICRPSRSERWLKSPFTTGWRRKR